MGFNILNLFKKESKGTTAEDLFKESKEEDLKEKDCSDCKLKDICKVNKEQESYLCGFTIELERYSRSKPSILLMDDNEGILSIIIDDLRELHKEGKIDLSSYNIVKFSSQYAAFNLIATMKAYDGLNIKYGIFDITLGGGVYDETKGNIVLDGIDAFIEAKTLNPRMKYVFFTGNKLNPYINKNKTIIEKFKDFTGDNINNYIVYKTTYSPQDRKKFLGDFLT